MSCLVYRDVVLRKDFSFADNPSSVSSVGKHGYRDRRNCRKVRTASEATLYEYRQEVGVKEYCRAR